jgi:hypothetical protein
VKRDEICVFASLQRGLTGFGPLSPWGKGQKARVQFAHISLTQLPIACHGIAEAQVEVLQPDHAVYVARMWSGTHTVAALRICGVTYPSGAKYFWGDIT